ncbi:MAG: Maf family protein, partial [Treponema sp.]|nr:Maf family protein [Treponema sp.]
MEPIILASSSPRRQEILKLLNIPFKVIIPDLDETIPPDIALKNAPEYLAARKVNAVARSLPIANELPWILGADTLIVSDDRVLGKPQDQNQAREFLHILQGRTHDVYTGIALFNGKL